MLLGGTCEDNLFQIDGLESHLDDLVAAGGNYIRNTMSDRDAGNVYAFARLDDGRYDLDRWNDAYWERLETLLELCEAHAVIVQIEVWDRFDLSDAKGMNNWQRHPLNPANNITYTFEETGFAAAYPDHPAKNAQPFYDAIPALRDNPPVLRVQRRLVDKLLDHTLRRPNVLYCMDNETSGDPAWGAYWADYIHARAAEAARTVCLTEMWDKWRVSDPQHRATLDHPDRYGFVDLSQINHEDGEVHWGELRWTHGYVADRPRPLNAVKIYGSDTSRFGSADEAVDRFWRLLLGGAAAARFHRPDSGLGLNSRSAASLRAARLVEAVSPWWSLSPALDRIADRSDNAAYAAGNGDTLVVYFPFTTPDTRVTCRTDTTPGRWVDLATGRWADAIEGEPPHRSLAPPTPSQRLAVISPGIPSGR